MPYRYDLFVSYPRSYVRNGVRHETQASQWVKGVFYPRLRDLWNEQRPDGAIFLDAVDIPKGADWAACIKAALQDSKCLVPVWTPPYFASAWCCAEWTSMRMRETNFRVDRARGAGLVVPVVFFDGDDFPREATRTQYDGFHEYADLVATDRGQPSELNLRTKIRKDLLPSLLAAVSVAPKWVEGFPTDPMDSADITREEPEIRTAVAFRGIAP